jgi:hypothetical protein
MHLRTGVYTLLLIVLPSTVTTAFAAPPTEACTVLTAAQVSSALGSSVGEGTYIMPTFKKTCTWNIPTGGAVTLQLQSLDQFNAGKGALASRERASTSGVGDEAYYLGLGTTTGLVVKKDEGAFKISVYSSNLTLDQRKAIEKALAQQVLAKF